MPRAYERIRENARREINTDTDLYYDGVTSTLPMGTVGYSTVSTGNVHHSTIADIGEYVPMFSFPKQTYRFDLSKDNIELSFKGVRLYFVMKGDEIVLITNPNKFKYQQEEMTL